jgi:beta-N-acetylhexosaminidase
VAVLSDEALVGQLFVVGIQGTELGDDAREALESFHVGGVILFQRNVADAAQLTQLTNRLKEENAQAGNPPLLLCVDEEGGLVSRMPTEVTDLPAAYDYCAQGGDPAALGEALAAECAAFGLNTDFAPVLDVWSNPQNTVIGTRAFSSDAATAAAFGSQVAQGMSRSGVIPVGKHFPGHGDTSVDSHLGLPTVEKTLAELNEVELVPFRQAISDSLPAIMVAHLLMTQLDSQLPASLSPAVVTGLLRQELGFEGVVVTDDLTMGAITQSYGLDQAALLAVEAGCDVLLVCHQQENVRTAYNALLQALQSGELSRERLEESAYRILSLKAAYGLSDAPADTPDLEALNAAIAAILPK